MGTASRRCVLLLSLSLVVACGAQDRAQRYIDRGVTLFDDGDLVKSRLEFRNALQIDPKSAQAWYMLARVEEEAQQDWRSALGAYQKAAELDPTNLDAQARAAGLLLLAGDEEGALQAADRVLAADAGQADALAVRATIRVRRGELDAAALDAQRAVEQAPGHRAATALLARIDVQSGDLAAARSRLEQALASDPEALPLRLQLIELYQRLGEPERVREALEQLAADNPEELTYHIQLANWLSGRGDPDGAESALRAMVTANPGELEAQLLLVELLGKARGFDAAESELQKFITAEPDNQDLRFALAELYRANAKPDGAETVYREIIERAGSDRADLRARAQLAGLLLAEGRAEEAEALAREVLSEDANDADALLVKATLALDKEDPDQAIADLRSLLKNDPESVGGLRLLAQAHAEREEVILAQDLLEEAIELAPAVPGAYLQLAELRARIGDTEGALLILDRLLAQDADNRAAQAAMARIQFSRQDIKALEQTAERALKARPDDALGYYLKGIVLQRQGDLAASIDEFESALEKAPNAAEPLIALARSHLALDQAHLAEARVNKLLVTEPSNLLAINLLGEIYLATNRLPQARDQYAEAIRLRPTSPFPYERLALLKYREGDREAAVETLRQGLDATGQNNFLRLRLAGLLQEDRRYDEAAATYEEILAAEPGADIAANNLAMLLVNHRSDEPESLRRALELVQRFQNTQNTALLDSLGWVQLKNGNLDDAIRNLETAVRDSEPVPEMQYHLGMAYLEAQRIEEAEALLTAALESDDGSFPGEEEARVVLQQLQDGREGSPVR